MKIGRFYLPVKDSLSKVLEVFTIAAIVTLFVGVYILGIFQGYIAGQKNMNDKYIAMFTRNDDHPATIHTPTPTQVPAPVEENTATVQASSWGGPELWQAVNNRRVELGVNPLQQRDDLCTIASIRLNQILDLGKLDNHEGFGNLKDVREDLAWIFEKYSTMAEFLAVGGKTAEETVDLWENTLGHKKLLTGGEYVWGCVYAQNTFAVAITAF